MSFPSCSRRRLLIALGALGVAGGLAGYWRSQARRRSAAKTVWTMIDVCSNERNLQADAHLLEFPDGRRWLVDAGNPAGTLGPFLKGKGVDRLDAVLLTHAHRDHYAGLEPLLQAGLRVGKVYMNAFPAREPCDAEIPWGCPGMNGPPCRSGWPASAPPWSRSRRECACTATPTATWRRAWTWCAPSMGSIPPSAVRTSTTPAWS